MGETEQETLSNVTTATWDFNAEEFESISNEAKDFISKLLVKDPRKRMSSTDCLEHQWLRVENAETLTGTFMGAGASVFASAHELLQSVRDRVDDTGWLPANDTLSARCLRILAGGVLVSVTAISFWKLYRRFFCPKVVVRITENPMKKADSDNLCKVSFDWLVVSLAATQGFTYRGKIIGQMSWLTKYWTCVLNIVRCGAERAAGTGPCCGGDDDPQADHQNQQPLDLAASIGHSSASSGCGDSTVQQSLASAGNSAYSLLSQTGSGGEAVAASRRMLYTVIGRHVIIQAVDYLDPRLVNAVLYGGGFPPAQGALPYCGCQAYMKNTCHGYHRGFCQEHPQAAYMLPAPDTRATACVMSGHGAISIASQTGFA
nr:hypothetical protein BaRGS_028634 [Batillaria attramentaria]